ncbi:MAG: hypothetical protein R2856_13570 [Caldilineaceae bacterium]
MDLLTCARTVVLPQGHLPLIDAAAGRRLRAATCTTVTLNCFTMTSTAPKGAIPLPGIGTVDWLESAQMRPRNSAIRNSQSTLHFTYTDFARPPQIYQWKIGDKRPRPVDEIEAQVRDPAHFITCFHTVISLDGGKSRFSLPTDAIRRWRLPYAARRLRWIGAFADAALLC